MQAQLDPSFARTARLAHTLVALVLQNACLALRGNSQEQGPQRAQTAQLEHMQEVLVAVFALSAPLEQRQQQQQQVALAALALGIAEGVNMLVCRSRRLSLLLWQVPGISKYTCVFSIDSCFEGFQMSKVLNIVNDVCIQA